jgi:hypothetical protein
LKEQLLVAKSEGKDLNVKGSKEIAEGREINDDRINKYHGKARKRKRKGNNNIIGQKRKEERFSPVPVCPARKQQDEDPVDYRDSPTCHSDL